MSLFIKNVELKSNIILAPMANFTDFAFRKMCDDYGAGLVCTEMVSASALHYNSKKTEDLLIGERGNCPVAVQIFGHSPEIMAEAVQNPLLSKFDIIDINMGCPARKIVANGDGSALLKNIELAKNIIEACMKVSTKPVTVKFRIGYTLDNIIAVEFAKMCEEAGASAITVHGRTTSQGYSGVPNYDVIRQVKESVHIPVFANGDCRSLSDAKKILDITKADGIMIGRGALGRPEIFSEILNEEPVAVDKLSQIKFHYNEINRVFGERYTVKYMRSHLAYYLSGKYKNSVALVKLLKMEKIDEIFAFLDNIMK